MADRRYVARSGTSAIITTPVPLAAGVAKTVLSILPSATDPTLLIEMGISFDGITAAAAPVTVELGIVSTLGTVTAFTPVQVSPGPVAAPASSAGYNATVEPTYQRVVRDWFVSPNMGLLVIQFPLGREVDHHTAANGLAIRCTAPAAVNCLPYMEFSE